MKCDDDGEVGVHGAINSAQVYMMLLRVLNFYVTLRVLIQYYLMR